MPEAEEFDVVIDDKDIRINVYARLVTADSVSTPPIPRYV